MTKRILAFALVTLMVFSIVACANDADDTAAGGDEGLQIGFAFYNLQNPIWAAVVENAVSYGAEKGIEVTFVDAGDNSANQISQIENFIQAGMDAIVVLAVDNESVEAICAEAMEAGIMVLDYSRELRNVHVTLNLDPHQNALDIVAMAEPFIKEKYPDGVFEWAHLDIPTVEVGVVQGNAIEAEMARVFPDATLVFNGATLTTEEGMNNTEAAIQANPNLRVVLSQSAGGGVGGNEAIKAAVSASDYDEWLLFSIDATEQEVLNIINGDPQKASLSLGGGAEHGRTLIDLAIRLFNGERFEGAAKIVGLPATPVTPANAQEFFNRVYA